MYVNLLRNFKLKVTSTEEKILSNTIIFFYTRFFSFLIFSVLGLPLLGKKFDFKLVLAGLSFLEKLKII